MKHENKIIKFEKKDKIEKELKVKAKRPIPKGE